ncbi:transporter [Psychroserpens sp. NJDZ02]|uniref:transporter n=1 Tax=Psychroserpens sp. NJDZ02 TaxID=2570561 RepID=UPI0010A8722B|nr:transporter [Psychroserpens sp. NJDZ02]QCE40744.1 transporter [Psychroserpens sp. NJDZ02]
MRKLTIVLLALSTTFISFAQEDQTETASNIQTYTPSKLLSKGQWDIKFFNNLYTQNESTFSSGTEPRETYFTSTVDVFTGLSDNNRFNVGLLLEFRSNVIGDRDALDVFKFDGETNSARSGFTSFAPAIKFNPFKSVSNFTIQTAFHIPLVDNESENGVFLDQKGFTFQNRFFYDYNFSSKWQLFTELNTEYHFGKKEESFANNSLSLTPGVFLSYFPSSKFTVLGLVQHSQRIDTGNDFEQDFTAVGGGAKYQLTDVLNIETLYTTFVRGNNTGLGQSFNIGLRALF